VRVVSLVPSLTDLAAQLGVPPVGVTGWCTDGAPADAARIGGTKNPDVQKVVALRPDVVLANTEENRAEDLDRIREAGCTVEETYPRTVPEAAAMIRRVGAVLDRAGAAEPLAAEVDAALAETAWPADRERLVALALVWRKPWMGLGPRTYASDLLERCGFANALAGWGGGEDADYPRLDASTAFGADVCLLPSEPYAFTDADLPAVAELVGDGVDVVLVDGQALTWHGPRSAAALRTFRALAGDLAGPR
jgi:ABC-type Fe3+-hydroxamate transport system substrate-binding protein